MHQTVDPLNLSLLQQPVTSGGKLPITRIYLYQFLIVHSFDHFNTITPSDLRADDYNAEIKLQLRKRHTFVGLL